MDRTHANSELILVVDDDEVFRERLARAFRSRGYRTSECADTDDIAVAICGEVPRHAVVDLRLPSGSGLEVVRALATQEPRPSIVVLTGYGSIATALEAVAFGAVHYLTKPAAVDEILAAFARGGAVPEEPGIATDYDVPSLARVEWEHIQRVLGDVGGNVSEAARRLRMHRRSLQRKLQKLPDRD